jgi:hypothetical protein
LIKKLEKFYRFSNFFYFPVIRNLSSPKTKIDLVGELARYKEKNFFKKFFPTIHPPFVLLQQTPTKSIVFDLRKYTESIVYSRPKRPAANTHSGRNLQ